MLLRLPLTASFDVLLSTAEVRDRLVGARGECGIRAPVPLDEVGDAPILSPRLRLERGFFCLTSLADLSRELMVSLFRVVKIDC